MGGGIRSLVAPLVLERPLQILLSEVEACERSALSALAVILLGESSYMVSKLVLNEHARLRRIVTAPDVSSCDGACVLRDGLARIDRIMDQMHEAFMDDARPRWTIAGRT